MDSNKDASGKFRFTFSDITPLKQQDPKSIKARKASSKYNILSVNNGQSPGEVVMNDYNIFSEAQSLKNRNEIIVNDCDESLLSVSSK